MTNNSLISGGVTRCVAKNNGVIILTWVVILLEPARPADTVLDQTVAIELNIISTLNNFLEFTVRQSPAPALDVR